MQVTVELSASQLLAVSQDMQKALETALCHLVEKQSALVTGRHLVNHG